MDQGERFKKKYLIQNTLSFALYLALFDPSLAINLSISPVAVHFHALAPFSPHLSTPTANSANVKRRKMELAPRERTYVTNLGYCT